MPCSTLSKLLQTKLSDDANCEFTIKDDKLSLHGKDVSARIACLQVYLALNIKNELIDQVVVYANRSVNAAIAIYSCIASGYTVIPIDGKQPKDGVLNMLNNVTPSLILSDIDKPDWAVQSLPWYNLNDVFDSELAIPPINFNKTHPDDIAFILHTSGSTGFPKGIAISHRAILVFVEWAHKYFAVKKSDTVANFSAFNFDLSFFDLFTTLLAESNLYITPDSLRMSPSLLSKWFITNRISLTYTVPSLLTFWIKHGMHKVSHTDFYLRAILFAGDVYPFSQLQNAVLSFPQVKFFNLFGPTETNVITCWPVNKEFLIKEKKLPIGKVLPYIKLKIHPEKSTLIVRSDSLFSYYIINKIQDKSKLTKYGYDTNDIVSTMSDNIYFYHGRYDRMIKFYGYRIEPGHIEQLINTFVEVSNSAVLHFKNDRYNHLVAIIETNQIHNIAHKIKQLISKNLPPYMHPTQYLYLKEFPYTANGKIDQKVLVNKFLEHLNDQDITL